MTYPERIQDTGYTESVIAPFKLNFYCTRVETKCLVLEYSRMESNIGFAKKVLERKVQFFVQQKIPKEGVWTELK